MLIIDIDLDLIIQCNFGHAIYIDRFYCVPVNYHDYSQFRNILKIKGPYADHILIPQGSTGSSIFFDIKWKPVFFWLQIQNFTFKFFVV